MIKAATPAKKLFTKIIGSDLSLRVAAEPVGRKPSTSSVSQRTHLGTGEAYLDVASAASPKVGFHDRDGEQKTHRLVNNFSLVSTIFRLNICDVAPIAPFAFVRIPGHSLSSDSSLLSET